MEKIMAAGTAQNSPNVHKNVIEKIQQMIIDGTLKVGDRLPPERELTEQLGVGRPALREALKSLEILGLIESRHGSGNYVVNHVQKSSFKPLSISFLLNNGSPSDVLDMRYCLECYAVRIAAEKADETDVQRLNGLIDNMKAADTAAEKASADLDFHFEIVKISGNLLFRNTLESLSFLMDNFIEHSLQLSYFGQDSVENVYREHLSIIEAIAAHNADAAEAAMKKHLSRIDIERL